MDFSTGYIGDLNNRGQRIATRDAHNSNMQVNEPNGITGPSISVTPHLAIIDEQ